MFAPAVLNRVSKYGVRLPKLWHASNVPSTFPLHNRCPSFPIRQFLLFLHDSYFPVKYPRRDKRPPFTVLILFSFSIFVFVSFSYPILSLLFTLFSHYNKYGWPNSKSHKIRPLKITAKNDILAPDTGRTKQRSVLFLTLWSFPVETLCSHQIDGSIRQFLLTTIRIYHHLPPQLQPHLIFFWRIQFRLWRHHPQGSLYLQALFHIMRIP
jgi:hypothetical protein